MRLDELKSQLSTLADDVADESGDGTTSHGARLAAIDGKVRRTRRAKAGAAVAAAAVVVGAFTIVPSVVEGPRSLEPTDPTHPTEQAPTGGLLAGIPMVPTINADGIELPASYRGSDLLAHAASEPGDGSLALEFVPSTSRILIGDLCSAVAQRGPNHRYVYELSLNGAPMGASECEGPDAARLTSIGSFGGPALDVLPGRTNTLVIRTTDDFEGSSVAVPDARLALAVYERPSGDVVEFDGRPFDRYVDHEGRRFELVRAGATDVADGRADVTVGLEGIDGVVLLGYGATSGERRDNIAVDERLLGTRSGLGLAPMSGGTGYRVWEVDRDRLTFHTSGWGDDAGWAALAIYVPVGAEDGE